MKHSLFVCGAILLLASSCSKDPAPAPAESPLAITAQLSIGGNDRDFAMAIAKSPDGGYVVAGYTQSTAGDLVTTHNSSDAVVIKYSANHVMQWKRVYGGSLTEYAASIIATPDGGYIFAGTGSSTNGDMTGSGAHGGDDVWVVKIDANGNIQWQKAYGGTLSEGARGIALCPDGGYAVAGYSSSVNGDLTSNKGVYDCMMLKISATGVLQWQRSMGSTQIDQANGVACKPDGSILMAGQVRKADGDVLAGKGGDDIWLVKFNAAGDVLWSKTYGSPNNDQGNAVIATANGYVISGMVQADGADVTGYHDNGDAWTFAIDNNGNLLWQKAAGGSSYDVSYAVSQAQDGGFWIAGMSNSNDGDMTVNRGVADLMLIKLSSTGQLLWQKNMGSSSTDQAQGVIPFGSRGCIAVGAVTDNDGDVNTSKNPGNYDMWMPVIQ